MSLLSSIQFNVTEAETSLALGLTYREFDNIALTALTIPPLSSDVFYWGISGVNLNTQTPVDDNDLSDLNCWCSHKFYFVPLTSVYNQPNQSFYITLSDIGHPQVASTNMSVYKPILPYLSGGHTIEIVNLSGLSTPFNPTSAVRISISNAFEKAAGVGYDWARQYVDDTIYTYPSAVLSGYWINDLGTARTVSGIFDYYRGRMWLDFHAVPNITFSSGLSDLYIKYVGNYPVSFNIPMGYLNADELNVRIKQNDTQSYYISAWTTTPSITSMFYVFNPTHIDILETNYDFTNVSLSATYKQRDTNFNLLNPTLSNLVSWPISGINGRAVAWVGSTGLSAIFPNTSNSLVNLTIPISGYSLSADYIQLSGTGNVSRTYQVTAYFPDDTLSQRTSSVYTFNYKPILAEDLKITTLAQTLTTETLRVYREVSTPATVEYVVPHYPLVWNLITTSLATQLTAITGIVPDDLTNEIYYGRKSTAGINITGGVGLVSSAPLCTNTGIITGYDNIYGLDYLKVLYNNNPLNIYTYSVSYSGTPFVGANSISDTHTFQVYSSATTIAISCLGFDNQPFTRSLTAKVVDGTTYGQLHPLNKMIWKLSAFDTDMVIGRKLDGSIYDFQSYTDDTLILEISTSTFDLINSFPVLCTCVLSANAYNTYNDPVLTIGSATTSFKVDTFPATNLFNSFLMVNQESSTDVSNIWREWSPAYAITAVDKTTIIGTSVITGTRLLSGGVVSPLITTFGSTGNYSVPLIRRNAYASEWLRPHAINSNINVHMISNFVSADFIVYPTYVFTDATTEVINNLTDPITSRGVSAYDVGHIEPFILSARQGGVTYQWAVDGTTLVETTSAVTYNASLITPTSGMPVKLRLFNIELPIIMPETYRSDPAGVVVNYPNTKQTTSAGTNTFSNIKIVDYDRPSVVINDYSNNLFLTNAQRITATSIVTYPTDVPIVEYSAIMYWTLSTPHWLVNYNNPTFDYTITLGWDDTVPGVVQFGATYPVILGLNRKTNSAVPNTFAPNDWGTRQSIDSTTVSLSYTTAPYLQFTPVKKFNLVNENVTFINETVFTPTLTAFYVNNGYSNINTYISGYANYITSYPEEGTFNLYITGVFADGNTYTGTIDNIVTIISSYQAFDPDISRVFGATNLVFPHSLEDVKIPPNEWVTAHNFNRSINLLNSDLTYLKNMTLFYSLPPIDFTGWLGTTLDGSSYVTRWHYPDTTSYVDISAAVSNYSLTAVSDVVYRNDYLYVADGNTVKIYNSGTTPTLLNTISQKTVDDNIGLVKSIAVDSENRLYVLDKPNNRVLVFGPFLGVGNPNSNKFLFEWGGLGGANARMKFTNPNDLYIDSTNEIWITDTGNKAIKRYTRTGSWLQTILCDFVGGTTPETEGLIGITFDSAGYIHALTRSRVYKLLPDGTLSTTYTFLNNNNEQPQKIITMYGGGFLYICLPTSIVKVQENGSYAGIFGTDVTNANFTSLYHNSYRDLYVTNTNSLLKYFETIMVDRSSDPIGDVLSWTVDDITVDKDEDVQDWVCNLVIKRLWDNIELFRRSLMGKVEYITNSKGIPEIHIRNYTPEEYNATHITNKEDIFVGINEFVTADVFNRCIAQLYESLDSLRSII